MADGETFTPGPIEFDLKFPCDEDTIRAHIAHSSALGLPELFKGAEPLTLNIIASGPSAAEAPLDGPSLAVNGALKGVFLPKGKLPTYWAACDPQELVADFLPDDPPEGVTYLVASKCHPKVFEKLKGRDVRLWHVGDYVKGGVSSGSTVTLTALTLFMQMGVRRFNVYGWDGCYSDETDAHHAGQQPAPVWSERTVCVGGRPAGGELPRWLLEHHRFPPIEREVVGGIRFRTTASWANEAQDALYVIALLEYFGIEVVIHGRSMLQAIRDYRATPEAPHTEDKEEASCQVG